MRLSGLAALLALGLAGCAAAAPDRAPAPTPAPVEASRPIPPPVAASPAPALPDSAVFGDWRIVAIDGHPPRSIDARVPYLSFGPGGYGGSSGCNNFGGLGVLHGDRFYAGGAMQTLIGCGELTAQEDSIVGLVTASPRLTLAPGGALILAAAGRTMELRRTTPVAAQQPRPAEPPPLLAGTEWMIGGVDGRWLEQAERRWLRFEADRWTLQGGCGRRTGEWRQSGDRIHARLSPGAAETCTGAEAAIDDAVAAMLESHPRFTTGPNGEILIGGGGHWVAGERPRPMLADESSLLAGSWRIASIDGGAPVAPDSTRIAFGPTGFQGSAGCNSFSAPYLAHARRLFAPPPVATQMACGDGRSEQERRVLALLASAPRIARTEGDGIALVDAAGGLVLVRNASGAGRSDPGGGLWSGQNLRAELTMLNGVPLQRRPGDPVTTLRLSVQRFDIDSGCGRIGGIWRRGFAGALELLTDPERPPGGACAGPLAEHLPVFSRLLNGPTRIIIGTNGELILAGEHHWLVGRVLGSTR